MVSRFKGTERSVEEMATLSAMFKLFDNYSTTIDKIDRKTTQTTDKILKASGATDGFNKKLEATGASANNASIGLGKFISVAALMIGLKKGMDLTDTYVNTNARLSLINDNLQTQSELQDKIFAAADRSRGSYSEMADAVAKMGLLAGDAFTSNDETIGFTELVQKSFKLGGADTATQQGAIRQLTQAMASGRLQGDEYVSISEGAPLILEAISKYTGLSQGKLKELSSQGAISADIIKNAMFAMGDDINTMFETLPMTFGDIWTKIGNETTKAFRPVMGLVNNLINTDAFQSLVNGLIIGINMLANDIEWLINFTIDNINILGPLLGSIATFYLFNIVMGLWAMAAPLIVNFGLLSMLSSPIFLIAFAIGAVIGVLHDMGITVQDVFGFIGGSIAVLLQLFLNLSTAISNSYIAIAKTIDQVFTTTVNLAIASINLLISALNKIPGINISSMGDYKGFGAMGLDYLEYGSVTDAYKAGSDIGKNIYTGVSDKIGKFTSSILGPTSPGLGDFGTSGKPLTIEGKGKKKKVEVDMDDEDLKYLRDIAERDYINKFSTATLAPHIQVTFGDVHEEADANKVAGRIKKILQEEIATAAEGAY